MREAAVFSSPRKAGEKKKNDDDDEEIVTTHTPIHLRSREGKEEKPRFDMTED